MEMVVLPTAAVAVAVVTAAPVEMVNLPVTAAAVPAAVVEIMVEKAETEIMAAAAAADFLQMEETVVNMKLPGIPAGLLAAAEEEADLKALEEMVVMERALSSIRK